MLLKGSEIAGYIKVAQAQTVRSFQYTGKQPQLAIINCGDRVVSSKYIELKQQYGEDIGVGVSKYDVEPNDLIKQIEKLNKDPETHGIIVQLPLLEGIDTDKILDSIDPQKDVDGLGDNSVFDPATPTAILWLLAGYNIDLEGKEIGVVGLGRLVGASLVKLLESSGHKPIVCDEDSGNLEELMETCDIVITATGQPKLITNKLIRPNQVIIDAGTSNDNGSLVGDVDPSTYERNDIKISPVPGGVGPLTVCALFANVVEAFKTLTLE